MEEQEKIDIKEHLIGWIDNFLEDGIVPQVVNPRAIKANYIPKSILRHKKQELEYDQLENPRNIYEDRIKIEFIDELMEDK